MRNNSEEASREFESERDAAEKRGYINKLGKFVWGPVAFKYKSMEEIAARAEKKQRMKKYSRHSLKKRNPQSPRRYSESTGLRCRSQLLRW